MGLDTSHDCWHGSYTGFMAFRTRLAEVAGIELMAMRGYGGTRPWPSVDEEPLVILLNHSDCDGEIAVSECRPLADRMEALLPKLDEHEYLRPYAERFIAGLRLAASRGEPVDFH